jgi:hypothetical protein
MDAYFPGMVDENGAPVPGCSGTAAFGIGTTFIAGRLRIPARAGVNFVQCLPHPIKSPEIH